MKHSCFFSFLIIFLLSSSYQCAQFNKSVRTISRSIDVSYLEGCETGEGKCEPILLTRETLQDSLLLIFPKGGTQSDVYLFSPNNYWKWVESDSERLPMPLRHDRKNPQQGNPVLDLTSLPDGLYRSAMFSCAVGGSFDVTIVTHK